MVATTSVFTRDAHELQDQLRWQMSLKDFFDIKRWLHESGRTAQRESAAGA
jgi:hypothetical protein